MESKYIQLTPQLHQYVLDHSLREPELLAQLRKETAEHPQSQMQIAPEQGQFMALLIQLIGAQRTLDIGTFTGYSSLVVAQALPEDGQVVACDVNPTDTDIARRYWQAAGVENKVDLRIAPALETLDQLIEEGGADSFDFAFIDADKGNYLNYVDRSLTLLRTGGLIMVDNTLWSGKVADPNSTENLTQTIQAFNQQIHKDERVTLSLLPVADGLTLLVKR